MLKRLIFLFIGTTFSFLCGAQGLTLAPSFGSAYLNNKVQGLTSTQGYYRQIQFAYLYTAEIGTTISSRVGAGVTIAYTIASMNRVFSVGTGRVPINIIRFPIAGVFGKYFLCLQCKHQAYVYASAGYAFNYPSRMSTSEIETSTKILTNLSLGAQRNTKGRLTYFLEVGYWNSGVMVKGGILYRVPSNQQKE